jgi:hypothetical protein
MPEYPQPMVFPYGSEYAGPVDKPPPPPRPLSAQDVAQRLGISLERFNDLLKGKFKGVTFPAPDVRPAPFPRWSEVIVDAFVADYLADHGGGE